MGVGGGGESMAWIFSDHTLKAYLVTALTDPHEKVVRFDVSMNEILVVEIFNSTDHLEKSIKHNYAATIEKPCQNTGNITH